MRERQTQSAGLPEKTSPPSTPPLNHHSPLFSIPLSIPCTQFLVDKILRTKIQETTYWKQHCFGATAAGVVDLAADLEAVGGTTTALRRPTPFLCLLLKLLQLGPSRDVVAEYIGNADLKYLRVLGALYARLAWRPLDVFLTLEPLLLDHRRLRAHAAPGTSASGFELTSVDAVVDALLTEPAAFDVALPRLPPRKALEDTGALPGPRVSAMDGAADAAEAAAREAAAAEADAEAAAAASGRGGGGEEEEEGEVGGGRLGGRGGRGRGDDDESWRDRRDDDDDGGNERRRPRRRRSRSRSRSRERRPREKWRRTPSPERRQARRRSRSRDRGGGGERRERSPPARGDGGGGGGGGSKKGDMSVEETNALRAKLGLAPLK